MFERRDERAVPVQAYSFQRAGTFYPIVLNYLVLVVGFKEQVARGAALDVKDIFKAGMIRDLLLKRNLTYHLDASPGTELRLADLMGSGLAPGESGPIFAESLTEKLFWSDPAGLFPSLDLPCASTDETIGISGELLAREVSSNVVELIPAMIRAAGHLLVLAHEMTNHHKNRSPIYNFLYHCRNAAAHNGLIEFKPKEIAAGTLLRQARWGLFTLETAMHGTPLFFTPVAPGLLGLGDPIRLLWEIEQAFPALVGLPTP